LRVTGCELRVMGCELWVAGYGLRVTGCELRVVGCGFLGTGDGSMLEAGMQGNRETLFSDFCLLNSMRHALCFIIPPSHSNNSQFRISKPLISGSCTLTFCGMRHKIFSRFK